MLKLEALEANLDKLSPKDRTFADGLISSVRTQRRTPSEKQAYWINRLADRATSPAPEREKTALGNFAGIKGLFDKARRHLKRPAIVLGWHDGQEHIHELRLSLASERARVPGSVNVVGDPSGTWFGRILADGAFEHSPRDTTPPEVTDLLTRFACDPAGVAAEHGKLTGKCCFCNLPLTNDRSTAVGYGPTCAKNYGLPWGAKAATQRALELEAA